jgi:hypothetical protein
VGSECVHDSDDGNDIDDDDDDDDVFKIYR